MEDNLNLNEASGAESQRVTPGDNTSKIVGAILLAGVIIAGAILLKDRPATNSPQAPQDSVPIFSACLESGKYTEKVESDMRDGNEMGVRGTPSSFILVNGKVVDTIPGALPYEEVKEKVERALGPGGGGEAMAGRPISAADHILGNLGSKVIVLEYSDLECPFCKIFHATMHRVLDSNKEVAWVYRHYPIPQLHSKAVREAEASECAWEQGGNEAFWKYVDRIFQITPSNDRLDSLELFKIAEQIGLK